MIIETSGNNIILKDYGRWKLADTFDCGQAFRFVKEGDIFSGIALNKFLKLKDDGEKIVFYNMSLNEFQDKFIRYFDLNRNYQDVIDFLSADEVLKKACDFAGGIKILRQDPWETICSFIISQNKNIPLIKGIVERLCENFGDKIEGGYTFPAAEKIEKLNEEKLSVIRAGFRAKYILDASCKIKNKEIDFNLLENGELSLAVAELKKIKGIGDKVASCVLLFAFSRVDALPIDVWIKKSLLHFYGEEDFPLFIRDYRGIAQQYLFHYARKNRDEIF